MVRHFKQFVILSLLWVPAVCHASLIASYEFNGNTLDSSTFANHGVGVGPLTYQASPNGMAVVFNNPFGNAAATHYVKVPNSPSITGLYNSSLSFALLYKTSDAAQQNGRLFGGGFAQPQLVYDYNAQLVKEAHSQIRDVDSHVISLADEVSGNPLAVTTDNQWHWGIGVLDRTAKQFRLYVGSTLVGQETYTTLSTVSFPELTIGAVANQLTYGARLTQVDRAQIYNHALTQAEIDSLVQTGAVPEPSTIVVILLGGGALLKRRKVAG